MAEMPSQDAIWATEDYQQFYDINNDGIDEVIENKKQPNPQWLAKGFLYKEKHPFQYLNYDLNLLYKWQLHLKERYVIGDIHLTKTAESEATISTRLGGTWVDRGTDTLAGQTVNVFEKTA